MNDSAVSRLEGLNTYDDRQDALEFAVAACCLKRSIPLPRFFGFIDQERPDETGSKMTGSFAVPHRRAVRHPA